MLRVKYCQIWKCIYYSFPAVHPIAGNICLVDSDNALTALVSWMVLRNTVGRWQLVYKERGCDYRVSSSEHYTGTTHLLSMFYLWKRKNIREKWCSHLFMIIRMQGEVQHLHGGECWLFLGTGFQIIFLNVFYLWFFLDVVFSYDVVFRRQNYLQTV